MFSVRKVHSSDLEGIYNLVCELEDKVLDKTVFRNYFQENILSTNNIYLAAVIPVVDRFSIENTSYDRLCQTVRFPDFRKPIWFRYNDQSQLVGYISCHGQTLLHHSGPVYEIQELIVTQGYRNKGIGHQLLKSLEAILQESGFDSLEVTSRNSRVGAHKFYLKHGFSQTHLKFTKKSVNRN